MYERPPNRDALIIRRKISGIKIQNVTKKLNNNLNNCRRRRKAILARPTARTSIENKSFALKRSESKNEKNRPIQISSFVSGVRSGTYPVLNEFNLLAESDSRHHGLSLSNTVGRRYTSPKFGALNR